MTENTMTNIIMTTIDHHRADVSERELFACDETQTEEIYAWAKAEAAVRGAVLINTCNRTELYLSLGEDASAGCAPEEDPAAGAAIDPYKVLCRIHGLEPERHAHLQRTLQGDDVLRHLCLLTAGARSRLWGDSQIISQVGDAVRDARRRGASDGVLNTVFRLGITAGKEIRTHVDLHIHDDSTADCAVRRVDEESDVRAVLVIGNGSIGRRVARQLAAQGLRTFMTLRRYRHGEAEVPEGVEPVPYADRYAVMIDCDAVVSATASPHVVVTARELTETAGGAGDDARRPVMPRLFIDMAVPRDVAPEVGDLPGVTCCDIDQISGGRPDRLRHEQQEELTEYVEGYVTEFHRWEKERGRMEESIQRLTDPERDRGERRYFPLFIDTLDRPVVVIGGGNIAERRVMTLAEFGFRITIVSRDLTESLQRMADGGAVEWICDTYRQELTDGAWMILACTDDRDTNRQIGKDGRDRDILVNVCDARNESTFWFPAVALSDELTAGLVGRGTDHRNVKNAAAAIRQVVEGKEYK